MLLTVQVDGEQFAVRRSVEGGTDYECVSNPAADLGLATSDSPDRSVAEHEAEIRESLRSAR